MGDPPYVAAVLEFGPKTYDEQFVPIRRLCYAADHAHLLEDAGLLARETVENKSVVQIDANQCEPSGNDTHDTFSRTSDNTLEQNSDEWEEGEL